MVAGDSDIKAPVSDAKRILKNLKGKKRLLILEGCHHTDVFFDWKEYKRVLLEFLKSRWNK